MKTSALSFTAAVLLILSVTCAAEDAPKGPGKATRLPPGQKWVFAFCNFASEKDLQDKLALMKRAKAAGYNGFFMSDTKIAKFTLQDQTYIKNVQQFRDACKAEKMMLICGCCEFGYANDLLTADPNLAEGMPVRKALFDVKDGKLVADNEGVHVKNGDFSETSGDKAIGWEMNAFKVDPVVKCNGKTAVLFEDDGNSAGRIVQKVDVLPWHYYHVTVMCKTENCEAKDHRIQALGENGQVLDWQPPPIEKTMDWTRLDTTFCSLDNKQISLMIGRWGPKSGKMWLADVKIEAGGFMNILRRESSPLTITSEDGQTTYAEGKDFSNIQDAKLLNDPKPGYFTLWHDAPEVKIPAGSALKEGQKVFASYNYLQPSGKAKQMTACLAEPKIYEIIEKQINFIKTNIDPDAYMMSYDEMRSGGYDDACSKCGKTQGQLLAESVKKCTEIIEKIAPDKIVLAWNDMFDPHHNANPDLAKQSFFYSVKGEKGKNPWATSWDGVSDDVGILTWQKKPESAKFWNDRGNQVLLAGYYDHDPKAIVDWLKSVEGNKNVVGVIYTTWVRDYSKIEEFIDLVKKYESERK